MLAPLVRFHLICRNFPLFNIPKEKEKKKSYEALSTDPLLVQATVYKTESGLCAAFLANVGDQSDATVNFRGNSYHLPAWSVSILPDCKNVAINTAKVWHAIFCCICTLQI